jgi:hypothetical protein
MTRREGENEIIVSILSIKVRSHKRLKINSLLCLRIWRIYFKEYSFLLCCLEETKLKSGRRKGIKFGRHIFLPLFDCTRSATPPPTPCPPPPTPCPPPPPCPPPSPSTCPPPSPPPHVGVGCPPSVGTRSEKKVLLESFTGKKLPP